MALSYGAVGTASSGTTSITPAYPTGISSATSELVLVLTGRSNTASTAFGVPSGWTQRAVLEGGTGTWGVDTGTRRVEIWTKDTVTGSESGTITVTLAGTTANTARGTIHRIEKATGTVIDWASGTGADTTNGTGYSATTSGNVDLAANDFCIIAVAQNIDTGTQSSVSVTSSGITFGTRTNRASTAVTNGNDHRHIVDTVPVSSGSGSNTVTYAYTISASGSGPMAILRMREIPLPTFDVQPTNETVEVGATGQFTATVSGETSLQWQVRDPTPVTSQAVDFDRSGGAYAFRTDAPNHNTLYSVLLWIKNDSDPNDYQHILHIGGTNTYDGNTDFIGTETGSGNVMRVGCAGGASNSFDATGMGSFTVGTGYWLAMVRESTTSLKFYKGTSASDLALVKTLTNDVSARASSSRIQIGGYNNANWNGKIAKPRIWAGSALTLAQLKTEIGSLTPVITTNLWSAPAFEGANLTEAGDDTSSNNRDFSIGGTATAVSSDGPPGAYADWTNVDYGTGGTTETWEFTATEAMDGYEHRLAATNAAGTVYSNTVTLDVIPIAPVITGTLVVSNVTYSGYKISGWSAAGSEVPVNDWQYRINGGAWVSLGSSATEVVIKNRTHGAYDDFEISALDTNSDRSNILSLDNIHVGFETITVSALEFPTNGAGNTEIRMLMDPPPSRTSCTIIWHQQVFEQTTYYGGMMFAPITSTFDGGRFTAMFVQHGTDGTFDTNGQRLVLADSPIYEEIAGLRTTGGSNDYIASPESIVGVGNQQAYLVTFNTWVKKAVTIELIGGTTVRHTRYVDLSDPTKTIIQEIPLSVIDLQGNDPGLYYGTPPWITGFNAGESAYGRVRGFKVFNAPLSISDIVTEANNESNTPVTSAGLTNVYYTNINPVHTDITDKSGNANDFVWTTANRPTNWSGDFEVEVGPEAKFISAVSLAIGTSATPGAQAITVPNDAEGVIVLTRNYSAATADLSLTSDFAGTFTILQDASGGTERAAIGYAPVTSTGSKNLTPSWTNAPEEGPMFWVVFVKNIDNSSFANWVRDTFADAANTSGAVVTDNLSTEIGDLIVLLDSLYDANVPGPPVNPSGWISQGTQDLNNEASRLRTRLASSTPTTTISSNATEWQGLSAISIIGLGYLIPVTPSLKYWTGSAWVEKPLKYWNGSSWITATIKYYNGSAWV